MSQAALSSFMRQHELLGARADASFRSCLDAWPPRSMVVLFSKTRALTNAKNSIEASINELHGQRQFFTVAGRATVPLSGVAVDSKLFERMYEWKEALAHANAHDGFAGSASLREVVQQCYRAGRDSIERAFLKESRRACTYEPHFDALLPYEVNARGRRRSSIVAPPMRSVMRRPSDALLRVARCPPVLFAWRDQFRAQIAPPGPQEIRAMRILAGECAAHRSGAADAVLAAPFDESSALITVRADVVAKHLRALVSRGAAGRAFTLPQRAARGGDVALESSIGWRWSLALEAFPRILQREMDIVTAVLTPYTEIDAPSASEAGRDTIRRAVAARLQGIMAELCDAHFNELSTSDDPGQATIELLQGIVVISSVLRCMRVAEDDAHARKIETRRKRRREDAVALALASSPEVREQNERLPVLRPESVAKQHQGPCLPEVLINAVWTEWSQTCPTLLRQQLGIKVAEELDAAQRAAIEAFAKSALIDTAVVLQAAITECYVDGSLDDEQWVERVAQQHYTTWIDTLAGGGGAAAAQPAELSRAPSAVRRQHCDAVRCAAAAFEAAFGTGGDYDYEGGRNGDAFLETPESTAMFELLELWCAAAQVSFEALLYALTPSNDAAGSAVKGAGSRRRRNHSLRPKRASMGGGSESTLGRAARHLFEVGRCDTEESVSLIAIFVANIVSNDMLLEALDELFDEESEDSEEQRAGWFAPREHERETSSTSIIGALLSQGEDLLFAHLRGSATAMSPLDSARDAALEINVYSLLATSVAVAHDQMFDLHGGGQQYLNWRRAIPEGAVIVLESMHGEILSVAPHGGAQLLSTIDPSTLQRPPLASAFVVHWLSPDTWQLAPAALPHCALAFERDRPNTDLKALAAADMISGLSSVFRLDVVNMAASRSPFESGPQIQISLRGGYNYLRTRAQQVMEHSTRSGNASCHGSEYDSTASWSVHTAGLNAYFVHDAIGRCAWQRDYPIPLAAQETYAESQWGTWKPRRGPIRRRASALAARKWQNGGGDLDPNADDQRVFGRPVGNIPPALEQRGDLYLEKVQSATTRLTNSLMGPVRSYVAKLEADDSASDKGFNVEDHVKGFSAAVRSVIGVAIGVRISLWSVAETVRARLCEALLDARQSVASECSRLADPRTELGAKRWRSRRSKKAAAQRVLPAPVISVFEELDGTVNMLIVANIETAVKATFTGLSHCTEENYRAGTMGRLSLFARKLNLAALGPRTLSAPVLHLSPRSGGSSPAAPRTPGRGKLSISRGKSLFSLIRGAAGSAGSSPRTLAGRSSPASDEDRSPTTCRDPSPKRDRSPLSSNRSPPVAPRAPGRGGSRGGNAKSFAMFRGGDSDAADADAKRLIGATANPRELSTLHSAVGGDTASTAAIAASPSPFRRQSAPSGKTWLHRGSFLSTGSVAVEGVQSSSQMLQEDDARATTVLLSTDAESGQGCAPHAAPTPPKAPRRGAIKVRGKRRSFFADSDDDDDDAAAAAPRGPVVPIAPVAPPTPARGGKAGKRRSFFADSDDGDPPTLTRTVVHSYDNDVAVLVVSDKALGLEEAEPPRTPPPQTPAAEPHPDAREADAAVDAIGLCRGGTVVIRDKGRRHNTRHWIVVLTPPFPGGGSIAESVGGETLDKRGAGVVALYPLRDCTVLHGPTREYCPRPGAFARLQKVDNNDSLLWRFSSIDLPSICIVKGGRGGRRIVVSVRMWTDKTTPPTLRARRLVFDSNAQAKQWAKGLTRMVSASRRGAE